MATSYEKTLTELFAHADVKINGHRPWDIQVDDPRFYKRVLGQASLGLGESYMDRWWDCEEIEQFFYRILRADLKKKITGSKNARIIWHVFRAKMMNLQSTSRAFQVGEKHYDTGNKFFENMLDTRMVYTCAYWKDANNLDEAQEAKLDLVCRKLNLQPGQRVLDIGCGWGSFVKFAAEKYGVEAVGITISKEQAAYGKKSAEGLPVDIRLQDYRSMNETFNHVVSLGMMEHVGFKNHRIYMEVVERCLKDDGLFLLHTIGNILSAKSGDHFADKYIFPNAVAPSPKQLTTAMENLFVIEDWHVFGHDYYRTAMAWYDNFAKNWPNIEKDYDERFYRMWSFAIRRSAGAFLSVNNPLWQIVLSKKGTVEGYTSIR